MMTWFKKQTPAFFVACFLAMPVGIYFVAALISLTVNWNKVSEVVLLIPSIMAGMLGITTILGLLILGIYRKNRVALALAAIVFPLLWGFGTGEVRVRNRVLDTVILIISLAVAIAIAGVYVRELRRHQ